MVEQGFIPSENLQHLAITSSVLLVQYISGDCFLSLFVYICHHLWHPMSADLAIASSAITAITLPLPMDRVEHSSSVVVRHSLHISPSTQQMLWFITAVEVKPLCSLWWSAAPLFSFCDPSFHHQIPLTTTAVSPYTRSKCWWIQDGSSTSATKTLSLLVVSSALLYLTL
jgi:hypothetical protein